MEIKYKFATGETQTIKVDETLGKTIDEICKEHHRKERMQNRYCYSLDLGAEDGMQYADENSCVEKKLIKRENLKVLRVAIKTLESNQIALIHEHFELGKSCEEIGLGQGVSRQAIENRLKKIYKRLQKHFE